MDIRRVLESGLPKSWYDCVTHKRKYIEGIVSDLERRGIKNILDVARGDAVTLLDTVCRDSVAKLGDGNCDNPRCLPCRAEKLVVKGNDHSNHYRLMDLFGSDKPTEEAYRWLIDTVCKISENPNSQNREKAKNAKLMLLYLLGRANLATELLADLEEQSKIEDRLRKTIDMLCDKESS